MSITDACILVINPGSTSTKLAIFRGKNEIHKHTIEHPAEALAGFDLTSEQFDFRREAIVKWLDTLPPADRAFDAIAGRGAPLKPLEGGTYIISETMLEDVRTSKYSNHASNLGPLLADHFSRRFNVPAFITDPISVDNFPDVARISGVPGIVRRCRAHTLNIKAVARSETEKRGKKLEETNFIVAHMGGGISIAALAGGRIIDVNDGLLGMGPFSNNRAGAVPIGGLVKMCFAGTHTQKEVEELLSSKSGLAGYLGVSDLRKVEDMIDRGDSKADLIFSAMVYQIAKEIGAMAAVLKGKIEAIILTGGMANSRRLTRAISQHVSFIAPVEIVAGEHEMRALAEGALRALHGKEKIKTYD